MYPKTLSLQVHPLLELFTSTCHIQGSFFIYVMYLIICVVQYSYIIVLCSNSVQLLYVVSYWGCIVYCQVYCGCFVYFSQFIIVVLHMCVFVLQQGRTALAMQLPKVKFNQINQASFLCLFSTQNANKVVSVTLLSSIMQQFGDRKILTNKNLYKSCWRKLNFEW